MLWVSLAIAIVRDPIASYDESMICPPCQCEGRKGIKDYSVEVTRRRVLQVSFTFC